MKNNAYFGCICFVLTLVSTTGFTQTSNSHFKVLAGHTTAFDYNMYAATNAADTRIEKDYAASMVAGIALGKMKENQVYREISLLYSQTSSAATYPELSPDPTGFPYYINFTGRSVAANFETGKYFQHPRKNSQLFFFGVFMQPQWSYYQLKPYNSQFTATNLQVASTRFGVSPRFMLEVVPNWWLDFTCAVGLVDAEVAVRSDENPVAPSTATSFDFSMTPSMQLRAGLAYRFK